MSLLERLRAQRAGALVGAALVMGIFAVGCGDDDDGDAQQDFGTASLRLEATSNLGADDAIEIADPSGTPYTFTSAYLVIDQIEFDMPDDLECGDVEDQLDNRLDCDRSANGQREIKLDGPMVLNLLTGETTPSIANLQIPALAYEEIDVEVKDLADDDDVSAPDNRLEDNTFLGLADFEFEGQKRELQVQMNFRTEAKFSEGDQDIPLQDRDTLVLRFDTTDWLNEVDITECLQDGDLKSSDGRVVLNSDSSGECGDLDDEFEDNFEDSLRAIIERP